MLRVQCSANPDMIHAHSLVGENFFFFFSIPFWYKSEKGLQFGVANPREYRDSILQAVILTI